MSSPSDWKKHIGTAALGLLVLASFEACAGGEPDASRGFDVDSVTGEEAGPGAKAPPGSAATTADTGTGTTAENDASSTVTPPTDAQADAPTDSGALNLPVGVACSSPQDCTSGLCKDVLSGSTTSVCVTACAAQTDCAAGYFCDPATPGAASGFCVPRSPAHCKTCSASAECGSLSEVCGTASGDVVKACHIDCTIAGDAACPSDYTCTSTTLDGAAAKVCRPNDSLSCLDSLGGFCDRVGIPQSCKRTNVTGVCVGQRACLGASGRLGACGAVAPSCKATCSSTASAGCTTSYCEEATAEPTNCGACGNVCPGLNKPNVNVGCVQPTCSFSCKGESYNVDNDKTDGCEVTDPTQGNHTANTATSVGSLACHDDSSDPNISGRLPSDSELHENAAVPGFVAATGSAPDYYSIRGTGDTTFNPCVNNVDLTLKMTGSSYPSCYHLHVQTNKNTYDCDTDATGSCRINPGGSSLYDNDTDISVVVSKRNVAGCQAGSRDNPAYTVKGHL